MELGAGGGRKRKKFNYKVGEPVNLKVLFDSMR